TIIGTLNPLILGKLSGSLFAKFRGTNGFELIGSDSKLDDVIKLLPITNMVIQFNKLIKYFSKLLF
ncbi:MAG: hypothetical protein ACK510_00310, partial [bacterium]